MATFSVNDQVRRVVGTGDGSNDAFDFSFQVNATTDVKVYVDGTLKTAGSHYNVVNSSNASGLNTDGTGRIKFTGGNIPANAAVVTILSDVPAARTSVYTAGGNITATALESDFDTQTMLIGDREERDSRALLAPVNDPTNIDMTIPDKATRSGKALAFNSSTGNPEAIEQVTGASVSVSGLSAGSSPTASVSVSGGSAAFSLGIPAGATGATGPQGNAGNDGSDGAAATIAVGSTTTGSAGSNASVSNSGSSSAATFDFTIPRGATGATGAQGATGATGATGAAGAAATIAVGTVTTGPAGTSATVTNAGSSSAATFNFTIPKGDTGATGATGPQGPAGQAGSGSGDMNDLTDDLSPQLGGDLDTNNFDIVTTSNRDIDLAPNGTGKVVVKGNTNPGTVVFNCESNSHGQTVKSQPHSASVTNTLTLPAGSDQEIVGTSATQTLTNKTLTAPTMTNINVDGTIKLDGNFPTGTSNVALGDAALDDGSLSGGYNTAVGNAALGENEGGQENSAFGFATLDANTSGNNNTALGSQAGSGNTTGADNTAVGKNSLRANTTANNNTAVGSNALLSNTTGHSNVAMGHNSLDANTEGFMNVAVGRHALSANTTADENTAIGNQALLVSTTGTRNVAVGASTLEANSTASDNTAVGYKALTANTTGTENDAFGSLSLATATTASYNCAFGSQALRLNTTGASNTAMGRASLYNMTTGYSNTGIGTSALQSVTTGFNSTAVGSNAAIIATGNYNVYLGARTGYSQQAGNQNTYLGEAAGYSMTTGGNNTIVGRYAGTNNNLDIRTSNNNIVISDGDGNPRYEYISALGTLVMGRGVTYSSVGSNSGALQHYNRDATQSPRLFPAEDDFTDLGDSAHRYDNIYATDGTIVTSDSRVKENISDSDLGLDFINRLSPKSFTKTGKTRTHYGLVAQDVRSVLSDISKPEEKFAGFIDCNLRSEIDGGSDLLALRYEEFISPLIQAVKDLKTELDAAKARIATLESG